MSSLLELQAAKVIVGQSGQEGSKGIFPIDIDKIVTVANMQVGAYVIAAQPTAPCLLSVANIVVTTADTMGTITFVGTDINGAVISEVVIPVADSTVYTTKEFASVTSATGAGWIIGGATEDTVTIGVADIIAGTGFYFSAIQVLAEVVVASQTNLGSFIVAQLSDFTKLPVGIYPTKVTKIALTSGEAIGIMMSI